MGAIADEDTADADAAPVLTQLRLDATAVREMQQRAADLRYSVERQVEDEHSDDDLQRRFGEFINDAIALLNPNLENEEGGATKVEMARKVLQLAPPRQTEQPEGKKGKKKGKERTMRSRRQVQSQHHLRWSSSATCLIRMWGSGYGNPRSASGCDSCYQGSVCADDVPEHRRQGRGRRWESG